MKKLKKVIFVLLAMAMVSVIIPFTVQADTKSGECGTNVYWILDEAGTLTISGTGDMEDYGGEKGAAPWTKSGYRYKIKKLVVNDGVTSIGAQAFFQCQNLTSITLADTISHIGDAAFQSCTGLTNITLPRPLYKIGSGTFSGCSNLKTVSMVHVFLVASDAFSACTNLKDVYFTRSEKAKASAHIDSPQLNAATWHYNCIDLTRTLYLGDYGYDVQDVQNYLCSYGYLVEPGTGCQGDYNDETYAAVTMFQAQNGLADTDGCVGNWTINKIRNVSTDFESFGKGSKGTAVLVMQKRLVSLGYLSATPDGDFGGMSETALKKFQLLNSLPITGVADAETLRKLYSSSALSFRTMNTGMRGDDVLAIQQYLYDLGYLTATPDGEYGNYTKAAVTAFQAANGLYEVDGQCGNWTMATLASGNPVAFYEFKKGENSIAAKVMQKYLVNLGYLNVTPDGDFGNMSEAAIKKFQLLNGLEITGEADQETLYKLYHVSALPFRTMNTGMIGEDVKAVQQYLFDLGYLTATPDGEYGNYTKAAVTAFQAANGLYDVDGQCGNWTMGVLASGESVPFAGLQKGDSGNAVKVMEKYLVDLGYLNTTPDNEFDDESAIALFKFQFINGLKLSGNADHETLCMLYHANALRQRTLMVGSYGEDVKRVQQLLYDLHMLDVKPDGIYGNKTKEVITFYQKCNGLNDAQADGMVGNWTLGQLMKEFPAYPC